MSDHILGLFALFTLFLAASTSRPQSTVAVTRSCSGLLSKRGFTNFTDIGSTFASGILSYHLCALKDKYNYIVLTRFPPLSFVCINVQFAYERKMFVRGSRHCFPTHYISIQMIIFPCVVEILSDRST